MDDVEFDFEPSGGPVEFLRAIEFNKNNGLGEQEIADIFALSISQLRVVIEKAKRLKAGEEFREIEARLEPYGGASKLMLDFTDMVALEIPNHEIAAILKLDLTELEERLSDARYILNVKRLALARLENKQKPLFKAPPAQNVDVSLDDPDEFLLKAKRLAKDDYNSKMPSSAFHLTLNDFYVVWFSKVLRNWKALVSTNVSGDGVYYELTYNGATQEAYVDRYTKVSNNVVPD
jgi:hypothetical protein